MRLRDPLIGFNRLARTLLTRMVAKPPPQISDLFEMLHQLRQDIGARRQPTFANSLSALGQTLYDVDARHPYRLRLQQIQKLMQIDSFRTGATGLSVTLPEQEYLYRISPIQKVLSYTTQWTSPYPRKEDQPWVAFQIWKNEINRTRGWLPLAKYASGSFASPREFSFWTSQELSPADMSRLVEDIHALGIPNDWLNEYCVLMRLRVQSLQSANGLCVPTVLDAFDSPIFHPTRESDNPNGGIAIKLDLSSRLSSGYAEFAIGRIDVSAIDIYPVQIPDDEVEFIVSTNPVLLVSLKNYYERL
jgi:hypothetical protein